MPSLVGSEMCIRDRPISSLDHSGHHHFRPEPDATTRSCQFLTTGSVCDQAARPPRPVSAISKPSPFFTKGFAVQAGMADLAIMEVAKYKTLITPLPISSLDPSGHRHFPPEPDTTTRSCQFLATGSVYDQATRPPRPVSAISKPSPFFTKGFAAQAGMADLAIMEVAKLKIYIRNCYVVLRTIGRLNGGPSSLPSRLLLCLA